MNWLTALTTRGSRAPSTEIAPTGGPGEQDVRVVEAQVEARPIVPRVIPGSCKEKARALVHKYAVFGTAWAVLPIPIATSAGLTALEAHLIYWVARTYGESPSSGDVAMVAAGLEMASVALKTVAVEGANFVPIIGWGIKGAIAGSAIEAIGALVIEHYEAKHPGRMA